MPGSPSWTFWPSPDPDVFGDDTYSPSFFYKVDAPVLLAILLVFFLPPVREWTGCNPWIILAGFLPHLAFGVWITSIGYRRVPPAPREFLSHTVNLIAAVSIPLSTTRALFILWILYLLVVLLDGFGNPKSVASFLLSVAAPGASALWHFGFAGGPNAGNSVAMAALCAAMGGVTYIVAAYLSTWQRQAALAKAERARVKGRLDERARIGRSLAGTLGTALEEIDLWHETALAGGAAGSQAETLRRAQARARAALDDLRALSAGIDGKPADIAGVANEIRRHAVNLCVEAGVLFECKVAREGTLSQGDAYSAAKIAIESVTNAVQHGRPRRVFVTLAAAPLSLVIEDDGPGFDPATARGRGLTALKDHAEALGGTLVIDTGPGRGTRITVRTQPAP
jgi:signal transduction histidine kinase